MGSITKFDYDYDFDYKSQKTLDYNYDYDYLTASPRNQNLGRAMSTNKPLKHGTRPCQLHEDTNILEGSCLKQTKQHIQY